MMMLPGVRNKTKVMMMAAALPYCPNQERHLYQILKIMVHIGIIPRSPCHTWIIFQTKNSQLLMIYCQFLSISRREETDICNCQQPCQQSALPTEVLPLDEGAEIRRHAHYLPAQKNGYCPSEARGSGEGTSVVKISEPKTSGWIGKCASMNKTADKQNKTEEEKSTNK